MGGFSGLLTHSKLRNLLGEVAFDVPMGRFVLESLGPRFPPADVGTARGSFSHPAHVVHVASELASVKQLPKEEILHAAFQNAVRFFQLPIVSAGEAAAPAAGHGDHERCSNDAANVSVGGRSQDYIQTQEDA